MLASLGTRSATRTANKHATRAPSKVGSVKRCYSGVTPERTLIHKTEDVAIYEHGASGVIALTRTKALNSLSCTMIETLTEAYKSWETNDKINNVVLEGEGKAFCAGGDVRALYNYGKLGLSEKHTFFQEEYYLNHLIGTYEKPTIAFLDGITMGGGAGLSVHGNVRVITEKTIFAMPEATIGFFPDVGGSYFLPRLPRAFGYYLAMTAQKVHGVDVLNVGVGTHYIQSASIPTVKASLSTLQTDSIQDVHDLFAKADESDKGTPQMTEEQFAVIEECFSKPSVLEIINALSQHTNPFAAACLSLLRSRSPTSVCVAFEELKRGSQLSLADCLKMEFTLSQAFLSKVDFFEGVRAALIDKDGAPKWSPATIEEVDENLLKQHFEFDTTPNTLTLKK